METEKTQSNKPEWVIKTKKWKDTRSGEIVERFSILDIKYMEEVRE